jgi:acetyltransferase-like isoleucine patch superfamily enzyme
LGLNISENYYKSGHGFIAPSVSFDGNDYSLITIGDATTISLDVVLLTHDYSISKGLKLLDPSLNGRFLKPISVGNNCFIGMRTIILPGTSIGNNVIVGAGSVVKGKFPDNVVICGNPAKIICSTEEWAKRHYEKQDYVPL